MSWRTSLAGIPAGLAFLLSALSQPGPWTWPRAMLALGGALLAVLATFAGDHRGAAAPLDVFRRVARREMTPEEGAALLSGDPPPLPARAADPPAPDAVELAKRDKGEP